MAIGLSVKWLWPTISELQLYGTLEVNGHIQIDASTLLWPLDRNCC